MDIAIFISFGQANLWKLCDDLPISIKKVIFGKGRSMRKKMGGKKNLAVITMPLFNITIQNKVNTLLRTILKLSSFIMVGLSDVKIFCQKTYLYVTKFISSRIFTISVKYFFPFRLIEKYAYISSIIL